jgi:hypothetical protein
VAYFTNNEIIASQSAEATMETVIPRWQLIKHELKLLAREKTATHLGDLYSMDVKLFEHLDETIDLSPALKNALTGN